jgi:predicted N-formylglutamate amidohydrolase
VNPPEYTPTSAVCRAVTDHIGWDIGAAAATAAPSARPAPAVLSAASRLRSIAPRLGDADLANASHGVEIPGNAAVDGGERSRRLALFYDPYHAAIDAQLASHPGALLLSVHSFTPELNGCTRPFDVGVLFDQHDDLAQNFARDIAGAGFAVRMNEPYSGLEGLIFSARSHGGRHGIPYLELEINNRLLRRDEDAIAIAARLADAVARLSDQFSPSKGDQP